MLRHIDVSSKAGLVLVHSRSKDPWVIATVSTFLMILVLASKGDDTVLFFCVAAGSLAVEQVTGASIVTICTIVFINSIVAAFPAD